jgi:alpha-beta hydrolase superfamily lysophospholipase
MRVRGPSRPVDTRRGSRQAERVGRLGATDMVTRAEGPAGALGGGGAASHVIRASDGVELHCLRWPDGQVDPWAVLVFLHGIASHGGWFGETAVDLEKQGVAVYAPDRRGSGRSGGRRGDLAHYERALDDLDDVLRFVASEHQGTPVFLAASSWAAKLAVVHAALRPAPLSGLMLLGPGLIPRVDLAPARKLQVVVGHVIVPTAHIGIPLTPEQYTTTPRYLDFIRADPLRLLEATARFFWQTGRLDRRRRSASAQLLLPILVLVGEGDAMMDVPKTRGWFAGLGTEDKTYVAYPGAGHTLDFEPDRSRYLADMLAWLSSRASSPSPHQAGRP